jgi:hypothetical protein
MAIMNIQTGDIGHIIQLAIAPVFLLSGVCTNLIVLTNRLARIIDRSRVLEDRLDVAYSDPYLNELDVLYRRSHLINMSIALSTACGLFVCVIVAMLFLGDITNLGLDKYIAGMFVVSVLAWSAALSRCCAKFSLPRRGCVHSAMSAASVKLFM